MTWLCSSIVNFTTAWIVRKWGHLLYPGDIERIHSRLQEFVRATSRKVGLQEGKTLPCFGSVDGTNHEVCKPSGPWEMQNAIFDGHHWIWAFVYMAVTTPDGILSFVWGPEPGCMNDEYVVQQARLHDIIEDNFTGETPEGDPIRYYLYSDGGYARNDDRILRGFPDPLPGSDERIHNKIMNNVSRPLPSRIFLHRLYTLAVTVPAVRAQSLASLTSLVSPSHVSPSFMFFSRTGSWARTEHGRRTTVESRVGEMRQD